MKTHAYLRARRSAPARGAVTHAYRSPGAHRGMGALLRAPPAVQRLCAECNDELQRAPSAPARAGGDVSSTVAAGTASGGAPLPVPVRGYFEPRFGHDFSQVRVHTGAGAAASAESLDAHAYTFGHDVVFGAGQYSPYTVAGERLLAHELAHVVQQAGDAPAGTVQRDTPPKAAPEGQRGARVLSIAKDGGAHLSGFGAPQPGLIGGFQFHQNFKAEFARGAKPSDYAIVQWIKGELFEDTAKGKVYWPASMGNYGRKDTEPWRFPDWIIDSTDADPRFGSDRGVKVKVPITKFEDSPGVVPRTPHALPPKLHYEVSARVGVYPWGKDVPTDIPGWESQKPAPYREVEWGWSAIVSADQKKLEDVEVK